MHLIEIKRKRTRARVDSALPCRGNGDYIRIQVIVDFEKTVLDTDTPFLCSEGSSEGSPKSRE